MATLYPDSLPCPLLNGFSIFVASGAIRSDINGNQSQRRVFKSMPHVFSLSFAMSITQWGAWQNWVSANAYNWFEMNLPSMYAGREGKLLKATLIRFTSPVSVSSATDKHVQVSVTAEMAPSAYAKFLEVN